MSSEAVIFGDCICMQRIVDFMVWFSLLTELSCSNIANANTEKYSAHPSVFK